MKNNICSKCHKFYKFGTDCWMYWEGKMLCSSFEEDSREEEDSFLEILIGGENGKKKQNKN